MKVSDARVALSMLERAATAFGSKHTLGERHPPGALELAGSVVSGSEVIGLAYALLVARATLLDTDDGADVRDLRERAERAEAENRRLRAALDAHGRGLSALSARVDRLASSAESFAHDQEEG